MTFLPAPIPMFARYWRVIAKSAITQIRQKNAGTMLGNWWLVISPLIFLAIYTVVYLHVFRIRGAGLDQASYILHIFAGLVPFIAMSEGVNSGAGALESNLGLLKNTVFPIELISCKFILSTIPGFLVGLMIVVISSAAVGKFSVYFAFVPVVVLLQFAFIQGLTWILSLITLVFKDVKLIVAYAITIAMITSPIAYTLEMIPAGLKWIVWLNPFAYFIVSYQTLIVGQSLPPLQIGLPLVVVSLGAFFGGYAFFVKLKPIVVTHAG